MDVLVSFPVELEDTDELKHILITSGQYFYHVLDVKKEHITLLMRSELGVKTC